MGSGVAKRLALAIAFFVGGAASMAIPAEAADSGSTMAACNIILTNGVELTFVGPQASTGCDATLQLGGGAYPTNRPPDTLGCGFKIGDNATYIGIAFGNNAAVLAQACALYAVQGKDAITANIALRSSV